MVNARLIDLAPQTEFQCSLKLAFRETLCGLHYRRRLLNSRPIGETVQVSGRIHSFCGTAFRPVCNRRSVFVQAASWLCARFSYLTVSFSLAISFSLSFPSHLVPSWCVLRTYVPSTESGLFLGRRRWLERQRERERGKRGSWHS